MDQYGAPPGGGYGAPPPQGGYGAPPPHGGGYGAPPPHGGYGAPPPGGPGYGGGFAAPPPPPVKPPNANEQQLWQWFQAVDADRSGAITVPELSQALVNGNWTPFDLDTVKLLMTLITMGPSISKSSPRFGNTSTQVLIHFVTMNHYLRCLPQDWQGVFKHFDADRSGNIDREEMRSALNQFGFNLSPPLIDLIVKKYDSKGSLPTAHTMPSHPGKPASPTVTFDRFVRACVVVKQLRTSFDKLDTDRDGWITLNYETFIETVLRLP
ncbi:hypothetical protein DXG01_009299 [Tephrocybe rancida]|nr:hypothetical protein DXG01_009299 [Tephrocybe rancida]